MEGEVLTSDAGPCIEYRFRVGRYLLGDAHLASPDFS